jgi:ubiquinone/menaquinone biosynthesis C-methylase UbiE
MSEPAVLAPAAIHFSQRHREYSQFVAPHFDHVLDRIVSELRPAAPQRLLDIGCGPARLAAKLQGWPDRPTYLAVDSSLPMLAEITAEDEAAGRPVRVCAAAECLPVGASWADATALLNVLQFTLAPARALSEAVRVTRPGGVIVVATISSLTMDATTLVHSMASTAIAHLVKSAAASGVIGLGAAAHLSYRHKVDPAESIGLLQGLSPGRAAAAALAAETARAHCPGRARAELRVATTVQFCSLPRQE